MILNRSLIYDLTLGDKLRLPEGGDSDVRVPPVLAPVVLTARPHSITTTLPTVPIDDSFITEISISRVNQASILTQLIILSPGLWEVSLAMTSSFDYTPAPPLTFANMIRVELSSLFGTSSVLQRFPAIGSFVDFYDLRLLLVNVTTISLRVPLTGATNNLAVGLAVNAVRIL